MKHLLTKIRRLSLSAAYRGVNGGWGFPSSYLVGSELSFFCTDSVVGPVPLGTEVTCDRSSAHFFVCE
jgi:hypothetical protein